MIERRGSRKTGVLVTLADPTEKVPQLVAQFLGSTNYKNGYDKHRFGYPAFPGVAELCNTKNTNMNIVVTGSLGHISKPLTAALVQKGHTVTVISSKPEKIKDIEAIGAAAAIGSVEDVAFLATTFKGADLVYTMIPPGNYFDPGFDVVATCDQLAGNYAEAVRQSGVQRLIHLSSIGAHLAEGTGLIRLHHRVEGILDKLSNVAITYMRPVGFYYNLYGFMQMIKSQGVIALNHGGEDMAIWVSPADIAEAIAEEVEAPSVGRKVRYVASDELTCNETARILGAAIGKPDLTWNIISSEAMQNGYKAIGMPVPIAEGLTEMYAAIHSGLLYEDYYRNRPEALGKVKMVDFAKDFAVAFDQN